MSISMNAYVEEDVVKRTWFLYLYTGTDKYWPILQGPDRHPFMARAKAFATFSGILVKHGKDYIKPDGGPRRRIVSATLSFDRERLVWQLHLNTQESEWLILEQTDQSWMIKRVMEFAEFSGLPITHQGNILIEGEQ